MFLFCKRKAAGFLPSVFCILLLSLIAFSSCETDSLDTDTQPVLENVEPTAPNQLLGLLTNAEDGMLYFPDFESFDAALSAVAPPSTKAFSELDLRAIEQRFGITTMQGNYLTKVEEFDSDAELPGNWLEKNASTILPFDGGISPSIADVAIRTLINKEGRVKVGPNVFFFDRKLQLVAINSPDESLIREAISTASSNVNEGIFVITDWQESSTQFEEKMCGVSSLACTAAEVNDHRVSGNWGISVIMNTTIIQQCFGPTNDPWFCQPVRTEFLITSRYFANAKVEDRGWFNRWTKDKTRLSFTCGVRAVGLSGSGQGWTSSSDVHEINVSWAAAPTQLISVPAGSGQVPTPFRNLDYVTGGVDDENISGLFCFKCCPWDCANSDENDIP